MTRFAEHHTMHHSNQQHPIHPVNSPSHSSSGYDASVCTEDSLQGYAERMNRCANIVHKRLVEFDPNSFQPLLSGDNNVRVWSLGPLKTQPAAGHRLIALAMNINIPSTTNEGVPATLRKVYELFTARRSEWDASRNSASTTLRTVCAPKSVAGGQFIFQCDVVRAATNAVCAGLISPREFLCAEGSWISPSSVFCCGFSLDETTDADARVAVVPDFVRGIAHPSGWKFEHCEGNNFSFRYSIHAQPGGLIPMNLVNETAPAELLRVVMNFVAAAQRA